MRGDAEVPLRFRLLRECLAAGIGGAIADGIYNPATVLQVRGQLAPKQSTWELASNAIELDGIFRGLWAPGLIAICLRALTYSGTRVGLYPTVRDAMPGGGFGSKVLAGCTTGGIGAAMFAPAEVVRVRIIAAHSAGRPYSTTWDAFVTIARHESVGGLWRGATPFSLRCACFSGAQLAVYESAKRFLLTTGMREGPRLHIISSCLSGICAQIVCHPLDTIKTLVITQSQATQEPHQGRGALALARHLVTSGGLRRLYAGIGPAIISRGPMVMTFLPLVECLRSRLGLGYI